MESTRNHHAAFLGFILAGDRRGAESEARRVLENHGVAFLYESVVRAALIEVGQLWSENRITVADEHLATAAAQSAIAALYPVFPWPERGRCRAVVACPEGERHEIGARMVADLLALDGWDELFFGADVPIADVVQRAVELRPSLVALSASLELQLPAVRSCIDELRRRVPATKVLVGGRAMARMPDAATALGADAALGSAAQAVEVARGWK